MGTYRVLYCSSEVYPLIKTGGLADVSGSLPHALHKAEHDVRIILPAYQSVLKNLKHPAKILLETSVQDYALSIRQTTLPGTRVPVWLVDCPPLFDRPGNPYLDNSGKPWPDNAMRFMIFSRIVCSLALNQCGLQWQPQVVHCNDWQTGLVPALLEGTSQRPATVFTIHNLAYQGIFDRNTFEQLKLPEDLWHFEKLEYHDQFSFIKGGLVFADRINTVSPNYAQEIQTPEFGYGLQDLLKHRADRLSGIINGIDTRIWNPGTDEYLPHKYNYRHIDDKLFNKNALQNSLSLSPRDDVLLLGLISRLEDQKGIDMLLATLPQLIARPVQLVVLGSGNKEYELALKQAAHRWPDQVGVHIGYNEQLAHLVEAGADVFLMPSRFEPCGLNQMYSQRYGTLPLVTPVGGLHDTVIDASEENVQNETATGFVMQEATSDSLLQSIDRAISCYQDGQAWQQLIKTAMKQDFSWTRSAQAYVALYEQAIRDNPNALRL